MRESQRIIGLTGGIGTGKTTVSDYLAHHYHLTILDADLYARQAVAQGSYGLQQLVDRYGPEILQADGTLDRARLAQIIFYNPDEKQWLEAWIHPDIRARIKKDLAGLTVAVPIVVTVPLLFEAEMTDLVTEIWVVWCPPEEQIIRLMQRNHFTRQEAQVRLESQMPLLEKCRQADVVLDNSCAVAALYAQVDQIMAKRFPASLAS